MRAVGYFRGSSHGAGTLAQQNKAFLEFCAKEGYEPSGTFADNASGNGHAPGFRELIAHVRQGDKGLVVVVSSVETMGSDVADAALRCFQLEGIGARVTPMSGSSDIAADIVSAWTAQDGGHLSERVRAAMRRKAVKGEVLGRPPYGYKVGNRRRLELIPEEAVVVRYIFRIYLQEGLGIRLIARRLNEEALKTRRGGNWSMVSIRDILRNRVYLGTYARFGVRVPGNHPALVSADDFRLVQDRLNARRTTGNARVTSAFLLSGLVHCGYCDNKLIGVSRKQAWKRRSGEKVENSYRYYQCESRTNQSICGYHTRRAEELEQDVRKAIAAVLVADAGAPQEGDDNAVRSEQERERERLKARARTIDKRIERYLEDAAKGRVSKDKMHTLSVRAASDRLAVEDSLDAVERRIGEHLDSSGRRRVREGEVTALLEAWDTASFAERQAALRESVSRVVVHDAGVSVTLRP